MTLEQDIAKFQTNVQRADRIVNGDRDTVVDTDSGPVASFARVIAGLNLVGARRYALKSDMDADLAAGAGTLAQVEKDPVAGNNGIFEKIGAAGSGRWNFFVQTQMTQLSGDLAQLQSTMRRVVVLAGEIVLDRLGLLGGGVNQMYIPQGAFIDVPGAPAANLTVLPAAAELPGTVKLAIPQGIRSCAYLDLADKSYKILPATGGDFLLPNLAADKIVPLIVFPAGSGVYASPYRVRELNPAEMGAGFMPTRPIVFSRSENLVRIPSGTARRQAGITTHDVVNGLWEEFAGSGSQTNLITYWLDIRSNTYKASAAGAEPFTIDPTVGVVIGHSYNGTFWSAWPHVGYLGAGRGVNRCGWGKRPALAPLKLFPAQAQEVDITEPNLLALGFTTGMRNIQGAPGSPYVFAGDYLPDGRSPQRYIARIHVQTSVDDYFGTNIQARFEKAAAGAFLTAAMTLEKKLSSKAARFLVTFDVPAPSAALVDKASPWTKLYLGVTNTNPAADIVITGHQYDFAGVLGCDPWWIELGDYPPMRDLNARVADLEAAQADPPVELLYGPDMWLIDDPDRPIQLYPDNINGTAQRSRRKGFKSGLVSVRTLSNGEVLSYAPESDGAGIPLDPKRMGAGCTLWANRYSDGLSAPNARYTREGINIHIVPATVPATTIGLMMIGDSLSAPQGIKLGLKGILASMGITVNFIGSRQAGIGQGCEARGGHSFASFINGITLPAQPGQVAGLTQPLPVGQEAMYLALPDDVDPNKPAAPNKLIYNPCTRPAASSDDPAKVFNGQVLDFGWYRRRWAPTPLGVLPVPGYVLLNLGTGDSNLFQPPDHVTWVSKGLQIVVAALLADGVQHVGLVWPTFPNSTRDSSWGEQGDIAKAIMAFRAGLSAADRAKVDILPAWAHMSQDMGWVMAGDPDPVTGAAIKAITDQVHYYDDLSRSQINKVHAAWIAAKIAGL